MAAVHLAVSVSDIDPKGNVASPQDGCRRLSSYGMRAASALNKLIPAPYQDKRVARLMGCSVRMAQYLRRGECWTIERLNKASAALPGFDAMLLGERRAA